MSQAAAESKPVTSAPAHGAPAPRPTLEAVEALGKIARILGHLSETDQNTVIRALAELK
jgi:hypothetical protein